MPYVPSSCNSNTGQLVLHDEARERPAGYAPRNEGRVENETVEVAVSMCHHVVKKHWAASAVPIAQDALSAHLSCLSCHVSAGEAAPTAAAGRQRTKEELESKL